MHGLLSYDVQSLIVRCTVGKASLWALSVSWNTGKMILNMFTKFVNIRFMFYLCIYKAEYMEVKFNEDYLQDLYCHGKSDKKHRFQPQIVRKYIRIIDLMIAEDNVQGLWKYNSLNYERLEGVKSGLSSVRVNDQYRIEFEEEFENGQTIATICNITDLSNHYK